MTEQHTAPSAVAREINRESDLTRLDAVMRELTALRSRALDHLDGDRGLRPSYALSAGMVMGALSAAWEACHVARWRMVDKIDVFGMKPQEETDA